MMRIKALYHDHNYKHSAVQVSFWSANVVSAVAVVIVEILVCVQLPR